MVEELKTSCPNMNGCEDVGVASDFAQLYKNCGKVSKLTQEERRQLLLKEQKEKRHNFVDRLRDFSDVFLESEKIEIVENVDVEEMDVENNSERKKPRAFQFMKSEWFSEIPDDLEENWLFKLVPEGFRVLVVAKRNNTVVYNKKGRVLTVKTYLPGGGLDKNSGLTVLDCIFNKTTKTIFILDCLHWNTMSLLDSETNFRFYWLKNKFDEHSKLLETNKPFKFQILEFFPAQRPLIQDKIFDIPHINNVQVLYEGITFYHKEVHYIFNETPLLGWLFSYMLPEKLGIDIPQENFAKMPNNYECMEKYIEHLEKKKSERRTWKQQREDRKKMDVS
ncbi:hypothetical protein GWI33_016249 [Rhynchophorus ferrugineus]|uniref:Snurportin-1 n=1 Tax=Rhynchophorus ferrugineus TaxID=354439 RepID=A0A834IBI5_RHYFE|nr:hypothetical protein GWI33_016249 [Rhynchophorus ferrugineus]